MCRPLYALRHCSPLRQAKPHPRDCAVDNRSQGRGSPHAPRTALWKFYRSDRGVSEMQSAIRGLFTLDQIRVPQPVSRRTSQWLRKQSGWIPTPAIPRAQRGPFHSPL